MSQSLAAFELSDDIKFPDSIKRLLKGSAYNTSITRYRAFIWNTSSEWSHDKAGICANGYEINRLGRGTFGSRYYIAPRSEPIAANRKELENPVLYEVADVGFRLPSFSIPKRIEGMKQALQDFDLLFGSKFNHLDNSCEFGAVCAANQIVMGDHCPTERPKSIWMPLNAKGALEQPGESRIIVYSEQFQSKHLQQLANRLRYSLRTLAAMTTVDVLPFDDAILQLETNPAKDVQMVGYIGVTGGPGTDIPIASREHLLRMDKIRRPYRVFGVKTFNERYALNDQVPHLIELLGGKAYRINPVSGFENTSFLGFDLGHPKSKRYSVPVMTVVDANGGHIGHWKGHQLRDETLRKQTIEAAIQWLLDFRSENSSPDNWMVLRDGKSFENDGVHNLIKMLGPRTTYVEIIKNPVPYILNGNSPSLPGSFAALKESNEVILQTEMPLVRYQMGKPIRIRVRHNPANHSLESIASAIFSLCHAPSLGMRTTRTPAPIYWADGLAKEGGLSLQFAGLHHIPHN